jgi:hypothetical protein
MTDLETRHYIGLTPLGRLHVTFGPDHPAKFAKVPPHEPLPLNAGVVVYPVSAEIAAEWTADDEDAGEPLGGPA